MNKRHNDFYFYFHTTDENKNLILSEIKKFNIENVDVVSDEGIKSKILSNSVFAVSKSGTVSLQISSLEIPSIIIYKLSFIKSIKIFNNTSVSDFLLPGKIDIIFLSLGIIFSTNFLLS